MQLWQVILSVIGVIKILIIVVLIMIVLILLVRHYVRVVGKIKLVGMGMLIIGGIIL